MTSRSAHILLTTVSVLAVLSSASPQPPLMQRTPGERLCPAPEPNEQYRCCTQDLSVTLATAQHARYYWRSTADKDKVYNQNQPGCTQVNALANETDVSWPGGVRLCGERWWSPGPSLADALQQIIDHCQVLNMSSGSVRVGGTAWALQNLEASWSSYVLLGREGPPVHTHVSRPMGARNRLGFE